LIAVPTLICEMSQAIVSRVAQVCFSSVGTLSPALHLHLHLNLGIRMFHKSTSQSGRHSRRRVTTSVSHSSMEPLGLQTPTVTSPSFLPILAHAFLPRESARGTFVASLKRLQTFIRAMLAKNHGSARSLSTPPRRPSLSSSFPCQEAERVACVSSRKVSVSRRVPCAGLLA